MQMQAHMLGLTVIDMQSVVKGIQLLIRSKRTLLQMVLYGDLDLDAEEVRGEIQYLEDLLSYFRGHLQALGVTTDDDY